MSDVIKKHQCVISSKDAKAIGKKNFGYATSDMLKEFFDSVCKAVLNGDDDHFVIQWAVIKLDKGDVDAINQGKEQSGYK